MAHGLASNMREFRKLRVWVRAHRLALEVARTFASIGQRGYGFVISQARRAAFSVPTNIVEGCGHDSTREYRRYVVMARASANELEYHLLSAADLELIPRARHSALESEVQGVIEMLCALIASMRDGEEGAG